ncbi:MAG: 30S ribosomal protein S1 [Bdellovibrionales bacterium RIFCSPHIGHO2_01_FULL_40_29]|nr:MAG: 30S ribosomal protein S1 [Bdellovibrionales bacterium RIFCSPHIGHO2_01_FULL_40_29]OFZ34185.1 MAG: 30S ribosomal protein S1 [Bdellovibrionales bacterium RIFCSPHIGHO2_02_FULL_40_15]
MSKRDIFGDELNVKAATDFASMFEDSAKIIGGKLKNGDGFTAEILSIGKEEAFLTTPVSSDAVILKNELLDENKELKYKVGDRIDVVVVNTKGGEIRVVKKGSKKASQDMDSLEDAFDMEMPVEGRVTEVCNGGFRVNIQGKTAFCPVSQMDYRITDHQSYVEKKFDFIITKYEPKGRNIVVSRRQLLDLNKAEKEGSFLATTKSGDIVSGKITRLEKFGAFVDIGEGVEGLVHISEIGWSRLQDPSEAVSVGQTVSVMILKVDDVDGRLKISLSIKQAGGEGDPWMKVPQNFPVGSIHKGTVEKKEQYGLFVNIAPGVTGLLPKSKWRDSVDAQGYEMKKKGDVISVQIDEILFEQKRISLGLPTEAEDLSWKSHNAKSGFTNSGLGNLADLLKKK